MEVKKICEYIKIVSSKEDNSFEDSIKERLDKSLNRYLNDLNNSYTRVVTNLDKKTIKGVLKQ